MYINIFKISRKELIQITPNDLGNSLLSPEELIRLMTAHGILFYYDFLKSNYLESLPPHPVLFNGKHTDFYLASRDLFRSSFFTSILASQLIKKLSLGMVLLSMSPRQRLLEKQVWVVGPSYGSAFLVSAIAHELGSYQAITRRVEGKDQEWCGSAIPEDVKVQLVDDMIISASSIISVKSALLEPLLPHHKIFIQPEIGVVINMSKFKKIDGMKIVSLLDIKQKLWHPGFCELCKQGSRPLSIQHQWNELLESSWQVLS